MISIDKMNKDTIKRLLPGIAFFLLLMPVVTTSIFDFEQKRKEEIRLEQERILRDEETKLYLMGKFDQSLREDFSPVPPQYVMGPNKLYLRTETLNAYVEMRKAAEKEGIDLRIASATRNFDYQKDLWNNKWTGARLVEGQNLSVSIPDGLLRFKKILEYSAAPGTSRHHWGTDIDINGADPAYFETELGSGEYEWLVKNAPLFGFCQTYDLKGASRGTGYNEEKWHWSYLPLAGNFTEEYKNLIKPEDIKGFLGEEYVSQLNVIQNYVLAINPVCL